MQEKNPKPLFQGKAGYPCRKGLSPCYKLHTQEITISLTLHGWKLWQAQQCPTQFVKLNEERLTPFGIRYKYGKLCIYKFKCFSWYCTVLRGSSRSSPRIHTQISQAIPPGPPLGQAVMKFRYFKCFTTEQNATLTNEISCMIQMKEREQSEQQRYGHWSWVKHLIFLWQRMS